jgi:hypothetical protein
VFDALIAQAGLKVGVDRILTFNVQDFERLGDEVRGLIEVPNSVPHEPPIKINFLEQDC